MVSLSSIAQTTGVANPDLAAVYHQLEIMAQPIAEQTRPLPIIAPAVNLLHDQAYDLEVPLGAKSEPAQSLDLLLARSFSRITDYYVIITGIEPPMEPVEAAIYRQEVDFDRKMIEFLYRLIQERNVPYTPNPSTPHMSNERRLQYADELKKILAANPLPAFAQEERLRRRGFGMSIIGWTIFLFWVLINMGVLANLIDAIATLFRSHSSH